MLDKTTFLSVIRHTPLVSIDLLARRRDGHILLGMRNNEPARGFWFVPGGRICKNETLADAFARLSENELGLKLDISTAVQAGIFEHLYDNNFALEPGIGTHYVVLAYIVSVDADSLALPDDQHAQYRWVSPDDMATDDTIHRYSRNYAAAIKQLSSATAS